MLTTSKILPINTKPETRLSFHLNTVLSEDMYPWFYEHFINIRMLGDKDLFLEFTDNVIDESYRPLFEERICYDEKMISDGDALVKILKTNLNNRFYSYLWVDKFEIPDTEEYQNYNFVHPVMVYGYDDLVEKFFIINFTWSKGSYIQQVSYDEIKSAYKMMAEHIEEHLLMIGSHTVLTSYRLDKTSARQPFRLYHFLVELSNYLYSRADNSGESYPHTYVTCVYGMQVYERLLYICENISCGINFAFKALFDLHLHKQYLYDRLCYIRDRYHVSTYVSECIDKFNRVPQIFSFLQMLNMKYQVSAKQNAAIFCTDHRFIEKMKQSVKEAWQIEKETLFPIYMELSAGIESKFTPMFSSEIQCTNYAYTTGDQSSMTADTDNFGMVQRVEILDTSDSPKWRPMGILRIDNKDEILIEDNVGIGHTCRSVQLSPRKISKLTYTECLPSSSDIRELCFRIWGLNTAIDWDFTRHEHYTWNTEKHIDDVRFEEGVTYLINGNDANLAAKNINISAENAKYVYVKYRNRTSSEVGQLFFNTYDDNNLDEVKSKILTIGTGEDIIEYVFDMSDNPAWHGVIKDLRFDPTGYDNITVDGECMIVSIKINDIAPVYDSKNQFCGSQGANGWFYYTYNNGITYREMAYDIDNCVWKYVTCPELYISDEKQNSYNHMATVRRYLCQSAGTYLIKYNVVRNTLNSKASLTIKRNHRVIERHLLNEYEGENEVCLELEYGESVGFEYYNEDQDTVESIKLHIQIKKINA